MLSLLVAINLAFVGVRPFEIATDPTDIVNRTFSYVIVGGGTAGECHCHYLGIFNPPCKLQSGLTVANRLTENSEVTVLVIESGQDGQGDARLTNPAKLVHFLFYYFLQA